MIRVLKIATRRWSTGNRRSMRALPRVRLRPLRGRNEIGRDVTGGVAAQLDFRSLPLILKGGKNGKILEPGSAETSRLYQKLAAKEMPPGEALKPTDAHIATIKSWIDAGAQGRYTGGPLTDDEAPPVSDEERNWWAFRKTGRA